MKILGNLRFELRLSGTPVSRLSLFAIPVEFALLLTRENFLADALRLPLA